MTIYEEKLIKTKVAVSKVCDICGKEKEDLRYIQIYHQDWGNDSCESVTSIEICHDSKCYSKAVTKFLNNPSYKHCNSFFNDISIEDIRTIINISNEDIDK